MSSAQEERGTTSCLYLVPGSAQYAVEVVSLRRRASLLQREPGAGRAYSSSAAKPKAAPISSKLAPRITARRSAAARAASSRP